ncbi:hypothetical protein LZL87_003749 [Fusarium oxysporum]|uniref:Cell surface glycoprotein 1 n=1 Tax=Fusarium oxysporum f. sp. rapae TaxID=485398 RepID=A0A8J5NUE9_FUSOX|nr:Cell surface glycoprotein 1 [Fusarium oxysporum f. sp. rapae]KAI7764544.1 hypothetical protein LZL87_003749 [Fusarium oxysporum]
MRLLKGLVLGLLLERGLGQTDTQPDGDSIATVADPVETDPADVPAPDPSVPSDGDTPSDPPDPADDGPTITIDDPQPTDDGSDARIPAPDPTDEPTDVADPSAIPDDPAETNTDDEQVAPTDQPAPTDTEPEPTATDVDATQTDDGETPQETDTNGEEATQTDGDTDAAPVVPTEALNSAAEETPEATPLASDTADDQVPQTTEEPSDEETEEPNADSEPEESTQQETRGIVAPTKTEKSDAKPTDGDGKYSPAPYASPTEGDETEPTGSKNEQTADGTTRKAAATGSGGKEEKTTLATSKGAAPTSPAEDYAINLEEADLGDYAEFQGAGDKTVVILKPPPNTEAKCDLPPTSDEDVPEGEDVRVVLSVKIADLKKGVKSGNRLQMLIDGSTIYDKELLGTGGEEESISSDKFKAALDQKVNVIHKAGDKPVQVTIQDANIRSAISGGSRGGSGGSGGSGGGGSGGGSGSGDDGGGSGSGDGGGGDSGSGGGGGGSGSGSGSGDGNGDSSGGGASESASGTGDEGSSPSSVSGSDGQTNAAGKNFMVGEVLIYALPLAVALVG